MANKLPPQTVIIGNEKQGSSKFDDQTFLKTNAFKICGIKICLDDQKICGIQFTYEEIDSGRKIICNDCCITGKNISQYEFDIPQNDFIQVIFGFYESAITQIGFITYKGQQAIFGIESGYKFNYLFMGYTFTNVFGSFKKGSLEVLGFRIAKLPRTYVEKNFSPLKTILYSGTPSPFDNIVLTNYQIENANQTQTQPIAVMEEPSSKFEYPTSEIIYAQYPQSNVSTQPSQTQYNQLQQQNQQNQYQQYNQQNAYNQQQQQVPYQQQIQQPYPQQQQQYPTQYPYNQQYGQQPNNVVIIEQQQPQQQQYYQQKQGPGVGGTMARAAIGTFAAIETVRMIENIGHHHHRGPNVVVMGGGHHHHRR